MLKNILLQFTDLYIMTCMYCREEDKLPVCIKTTRSCIQKKKLRLCFYVWTRMAWPQISESTFYSKIPSHNSWKTAQLTKIVCNNVPLTVQRFEHNALSPLWLLDDRVFDRFIQFKVCVKSVSCYFHCFNGFTAS